MENEFLTDSELVATVADIKSIEKKLGVYNPYGIANHSFTNGEIKTGQNNSADSLFKLTGRLKDYWLYNYLNEFRIYSINKDNSDFLVLIQLLADGTISKIGGGSFSALSDERMKKEIVPFNSGLEKVLAIQPKKFKYNAVAGTPTENYPEIITDKQQYGVIAQDLQNVCPEMVTADENGFLSVDLSNLSLLLINAVKELNTKIGTLEARILALETPQA